MTEKDKKRKDGETTLEESSLMEERRASRSKTPKSKRMWRSAKSTILSFLPILQWLPKYSIKENLMNDMVGGFTVGIMHVPQGIAYASLAGVRPVIGLYTSLIAPFFYMFFGTSRHISIGVFAVVSLMCGACNVRVTEAFFENSSSNFTDDALAEAKLDYGLHVLSGLGFLVGLIQLSLGLLRLDFLLSFLSDQVVTGFMVGASFHVLVAQMDKLLGIVLPRRGGIGKLLMTVYDIFSSLISLEFNLYTTAMSIIAIVFLFSIKTFVDPLVKKFTTLPVPYDLILLIIGTILSTVFDFSGRFKTKIIGKIPTGLPSLSSPDLSVIPSVIGDAVAISIVSLVVSISMAKLFAKKHGYRVDVRQEFYAFGLVSSLGSFFPVWPSSTALARTLVYEAAGTKTQLATIFSCSLLLAVLFFVGPFLELLPVCFLSCVIVVALKGMFLKLADIPTLWRVSKIDAIIFVLTLFATISLNVIEGLACGAAVSIIRILLASKRGGFNEIECDRVENMRTKSQVRIMRYDGALFFMNTELFSNGIALCLKTMKQSVREGEGEVKSDEERTIIIDLSTLRFIDYSGSRTLLNMISSSKKDNVRIIYVDTFDTTLSMLRLHPNWKVMEASFFDSIEDYFEASC